MAFQITAAQLAKFAPTLKQIELLPYVQAINFAMAKVGIDQSARRVRYFMSQSFYETKQYTFWDEDLVYKTPERLVEVWPSRFTMDRTVTTKAYAPDYINNSQKLANLVYSNRYGNGNVDSGDGWRFHGRGAFHLTFKDNYAAYGLAYYGNANKFVIDPDGINSMTDRFMSAAWFWETKKLGALADSDSFTAMTKVINGSEATVPKRLPYLKLANTVFSW